MGGFAFAEYLYGWVWVGVTVQITFMGGCTFLEYIYGWVWVVCDCLKHIYGWVCLYRTHLEVGVTVFRAFLWMGVTGYDWVWVGVLGCRQVCKMVRSF